MLSGPPTPNVTTATAVCPLLKYLSARFFVRSLIRPTCSGQRCRTIQWQKSQTLETPQVGVEIQGSDPMFREGRWLVGFGVMYLRHYDEKIPTRMHTAGAYTWTQSLEEVVVAVGCPKAVKRRMPWGLGANGAFQGPSPTRLSAKFGLAT
eukprot:3736005-Pyramimonas_sp.AAC.1